ncbi:MAG: hypothetical protein WCH34_04800 [Bacteroidota bacterium]
MTDEQRIHTRAARVTFKAIENKPSVIVLVPIMGTRLNEGKALLQAFLTADQKVLANESGIAITKQVARDNLIVDVEFGYAVIYSYAIEIKDETLKESSYYTASSFNLMSGEELLNVGKNLKIKLAGFQLADLEPHGFTSGDSTELNVRLTAFEDLLVAPEKETKEHKILVADRDEKHSKMVAFMNDDLDAAARLLKKKDRDFYQLYKICRKLHLQGHRKRKKNEAGSVNDEYTKKVGPLKIEKIDFQIGANKTYLFSNIGDRNLKWWTQESSEAPLTIPLNAGVLTAGEEFVKTSVELEYSTKPHLFFANESNSEDGEVAIDEVD